MVLSGEPNVDRLGLFIHHDWEMIDGLEATGAIVDPDDHILAVEVWATGELRRPTAEDVERVKTVSAEVRRRRDHWTPPAERGR